MEGEKKQEVSILSIHEQERTDKQLEDEGVWVDDIRPGARFKLGRMNNKKYTRLYRDRIRGLRSQTMRGTLDPEVENDIVKDCFASACFFDFEGPAMVNADGTAMENTYESRRDLLEYDDLWNDLLAASNYKNFFREEAQEQAKGN